MTLMRRNDNPTHAPKMAYRLEIARTMEVFGVDTGYQMGKLLGMPNLSTFYRYLSGYYTPSSKYLWRMHHLMRCVLTNQIEIATFKPEEYWPALEDLLLKQEEEERKNYAP